MEREKLESLIIDYIDNKLGAADRRIVEQELVGNPEAYKLYEELKEVINVMERSAELTPSARLNGQFEKMLQQELKGSASGRSVFFSADSLSRRCRHSVGGG